MIIFSLTETGLYYSRQFIIGIEPSDYSGD